MNVSGRLLRVGALTHDLGISLIAFGLAHTAAFGPKWFVSVPDMEIRIVVFLAITLLSIFVMRLNRGLWRYASIPDMLAIVKAASLTVIVFVIIYFLVARGDHVSRLAMILTWTFMIFGMATGRVTYRVLKEMVILPQLGGSPEVGKSLLFPFSDSTETYIRALRRQGLGIQKIAGIIDNRRTAYRREMHGLSMLGQPVDIIAIAKKAEQRGQKIDELIVTDPSITGSEIADLLDNCNEAGIGIKRLPGLIEPGEAAAAKPVTPNPLRLDDLLGRPEVNVDYAAVADFLTDKTVLVTGAGGSIGSELCHRIASFSPARIVLVEANEHNLYTIERTLRKAYPKLALVQLVCDVRDVLRVNTIMQRERPDVVFHAAALKHVPIAERNPVEAVKTNALGTATVADAACRAGVHSFVLISTDKAVKPSSVMGASKRAAELYCQALDLAQTKTTFRIVRFGNVLGSTGSVVPLFQDQIASGGPVTVTDPEVTRFFMTIQEAVNLILEAVSHGVSSVNDQGAVLVLEMGDSVKIVDLARRIIQLGGLVPGRDIKIVYSGLRPGEKLTEELFNSDEDDIIQRRNGFFVARTRTVDTKTITGWFAELRAACQEDDNKLTYQILKLIVPSFTELQNGRIPIVKSRPDSTSSYEVDETQVRRLH